MTPVLLSRFQLHSIPSKPVPASPSTSPESRHTPAAADATSAAAPGSWQNMAQRKSTFFDAWRENMGCLAPFFCSESFFGDDMDIRSPAIFLLTCISVFLRLVDFLKPKPFPPPNPSKNNFRKSLLIKALTNAEVASICDQMTAKPIDFGGGTSWKWWNFPTIFSFSDPFSVKPHHSWRNDN